MEPQTFQNGWNSALELQVTMLGNVLQVLVHRVHGCHLQESGSAFQTMAPFPPGARDGRKRYTDKTVCESLVNGTQIKVCSLESHNEKFSSFYILSVLHK